MGVNTQYSVCVRDLQEPFMVQKGYLAQNQEINILQICSVVSF